MSVSLSLNVFVSEKEWFDNFKSSSNFAVYLNDFSVCTYIIDFIKK